MSRSPCPCPSTRKISLGMGLSGKSGPALASKEEAPLCRTDGGGSDLLSVPPPQGTVSPELPKCNQVSAHLFAREGLLREPR